MARCNECNRFVVVNHEDDPDVARCDINNGTLEIEVRIVTTCAECGNELYEFTFNIEHDVDHEHVEQLDVDEGAPHPLEATRNAKRFYGFNLVVKVTCNEPECDFVEEVEIEDYVPASEMEDI